MVTGSEGDDESTTDERENNREETKDNVPQVDSVHQVDRVIQVDTVTSRIFIQLQIEWQLVVYLAYSLLIGCIMMTSKMRLTR